NIVLESFINEHIQQNYQLLLNARLEHVQSYIDNYQQEAKNKAKIASEVKGGHLFILNKDGKLIFSSQNHEPAFIETDWKTISSKLVTQNPDYILRGHLESDHYSDIYTARYFQPWGWVIFYSVSDSEIRTLVNNILLVTFGVTALCAFGGSFLIFILSNIYLVHPVNTLKDAASKIAAHQNINTIEINSKDEIGMLARSMETMSQSIHSYKTQRDLTETLLLEKQDELSQNQQKLKTHRDSLEDIVELRTIKLSETNKHLHQEIKTRKLAEDQIKASLREKQTLLDEIHHRVKNNMNVVSSLLKLQANNIEDDRMKAILQESQNRVYAMSAIHETLHGSENLSEIDLKKYLFKISTSIFQSSSVNPEKVKLKNDIEEMPIGINQASPLGLIINELMSNSLKYAFPDDRGGEIRVSVKKLDTALELIMRDDGVGIPTGLDWKNSSTLGLKLVRTLVENQLDGSIDMENKNGTKFTIKFNLDKS
ncbi:MAG: HAMP domain-containing protein, partial [Deltaproteobacteria bacterium]|nr:HAMP domain-containing protein [Deltaproteobacteria bacterium]